MPIIVADKTTGERFILVGTGYAATETATPGVFLGNLSPDIKTKTIGVVAVCNGDGIIGWFSSADLVVVEIDGQPPSQFLTSAPYR
jgi:hypothetical protein